MSDRTVQKFQAIRMAKDAGLTRNQRNRLKFRDGMAVDAVWLLISIVVKERELRDKTRETAIGVGAEETKAYSDQAGQA